MTQRVSVALATYNGAAYLEAQLASLAAQRELPCELVVCDDGSSDTTLAILERFARDAPFEVRIHRNPRRLGYADNFMLAAARCNGDLIAFCDQDDVWHQDKLAIAERAFNGSDPAPSLFVHVGLQVNAELESLGRRYPPIRRERVCGILQLDPWLLIPGFAMVFPRWLCELTGDRVRLAGLSGPGGTPMAHDQWIYFLASATGHTALSPLELVYHRHHRDNAAGLPSTALAERARHAVRAGAARYRYGAELAATYAEFLNGLRESVVPERRAYVERAVKCYLRAAASLRLREHVYAAESSRTQRFANIARLVESGAYRARERGGFGLPALLKDVTFGSGFAGAFHGRALVGK